jgi:hypothetical protein
MIEPMCSLAFKEGSAKPRRADVRVLTGDHEINALVWDGRKVLCGPDLPLDVAARCGLGA